MALIKCPECGEEISDKAVKCPKCGAEFPVEKPQKVCKECGEVLGDEETVCHKCGCPIENQQEEKQTPEIKGKKPFSKKYLVVAIGIVVIIGLIAGVGVKSLNKKKVIEQQNAEVQEIKEYNQYVGYLNSVYSEALAGASEAEDVCVLVVNVWQDAIFDDSSDETSKYVSGVSDFNEALERVYADEDIKEKLSSIKDYEGYLETNFKNLQSVPSELEKAYDAAVQVNTAFKALAQMAESPTGSYNSYSADEKEKVNAFMSAYSTLEAIIPSKKEVPVYEDGKEVKNTLSFLIYKNQMINKLPQKVIDQSPGKVLGLYEEEAIICGKKGKITYHTFNNVIGSIQWTLDSYEEADKQQLINYLKKRYGEATESDGGIYWTNNDNIDNAYVSMNEDKNGGLTINWN